MNLKTEIINSQKTLLLVNRKAHEIVVKARFGPSKPTKIPLLLSEELSCFIASIIGDGHIRRDKFQIYLDSTNLELLKKFQTIANKLFKRDFHIGKEKISYKLKRYYLIIDSKAIHNLLTKVFETPAGKKSDSVKVPGYIKKEGISIKAAFLIGILVTEGGRRRRGYGLSTASKTLWGDLQNLLNDLKVGYQIDTWIHKGQNKEYFGLVFKKDKLTDILSKCQSVNVRSLIGLCPNFY